MITILKGNIISADKINEFKIFKDSYLVAEDGKIVGIFEKLPQKYKDEKVEDYGNKLIFQAFSDMHLHGPQYAMLGTGLDLQLLDWLNTYTFPVEAQFKDQELARDVSQKLAKELVRNGTTRVCMFSSTHVDSTLILMEELDKAGISGYVGKVNMDRNGGKNYQETTEESLKETKRWLAKCNFKNIKPIITPRFTPACSDELLKQLGKIAIKSELPIQSHLSENKNEIEWVKKLCPDSKEYWETYKKHKLWTNKTLMAHCVHSTESELEAIKKAGVYVVHCPSSNQNVISGYAQIKEMLNKGIRVVLGSDIAGGDHISMFENIVDAIKVSKGNHYNSNYKIPFLTVEEAFYLATSASAPFFNERPGLAKNNVLNVIVLDDSNLAFTDKLSIKERFKRAIYTRQKDAIVAVYNGVKIY